MKIQNRKKKFWFTAHIGVVKLFKVLRRLLEQVVGTKPVGICVQNREFYNQGVCY